MVTLYDKKQKKPLTATNRPGDEILLVSISENKDLAEMKAQLRKGNETGEVGYDAKVSEPAQGASPCGPARQTRQTKPKASSGPRASSRPASSTASDSPKTAQSATS